MKLIVGLGNPGKEYENTRHNVGYKFVDYYAQKNELEFKKKMDAYYSEFTIADEKIIIIKPTTFMNLSGTAVLNYVNFYKIDINDILVIYDDTSFDLGKIKLKLAGSSAGHNGINDIINKLGTNHIKRVKIGIAKNNFDLKKYVLSKFTKKELEELEKVLEENISIIDDFSKIDFDKIMSKYNK